MPIEKWSENITVVHLADDPQFSEDLDALERRTTPTSIVMDFGAVHYVNSSNIAGLLRIRRICNDASKRLLLCSLNNQVWGALLMTGLDKILDVSENVTTALATLQLQNSKKNGK